MKTGFDINMDSLYREIRNQLNSRHSDQGENFVDQATYYRAKKKKSNQTGKTKAKRKPRRTTVDTKKIPYSPDLNNALERLSNKKLYRLYSSLCRVSLVETTQYLRMLDLGHCWKVLQH